ncbi:MAG: hypothetical protein EZS28_027267 [Streblomastix strix]|uniref:Uncharacterized protein n=1 Tax=Streblomastix strix TaxID=222440 RepID=A0A5J4V3L6_9EUKA|nr:MAG: hypothetical protein EZS28_027267 [Streblomastix strix]
MGIMVIDVGYNFDKKMRKGSIFACQSADLQFQTKIIEYIQTFTCDVLMLFSPRIVGLVMSCFFTLIENMVPLMLAGKQPFFKSQGNTLVNSYAVWQGLASTVSLICQIVPGIPKVYWASNNDPTTLLSSFTVVQMVAVGIPFLILG